MKLLLLLTTLVLPTSAFIFAPTIPISINGQTFFGLVDINSIGSYVYGAGIGGIYNPEKSNTYKDLKTPFTVNYNGAPFYGDHTITGKMAEDTNADIISEDKAAIRFGLVEELKGKGYFGAFAMPVEGVLGYNPWLKEETNTNVTDVLMQGRGRKLSLQLQRVFFMGHNTLTQSLYAGACIVGQQNAHPVVIPVKSNPNKFWQIEFQGYQVEGPFVKKNIDAVFSTSFPDLGVPLPVFLQISRRLKAKKNARGRYAIPCNQLNNANSLTLKVNKELLVLNNTRLTFNEEFGDSIGCYLRVRPVTGNTWIFGINFYEHFSVCYRPDTNSIQLDNIDKGRPTTEELIESGSQITLHAAGKKINYFRH